MHDKLTNYRINGWTTIAIVLALFFCAPATVQPQEASKVAGHTMHRSIPPPGAKTHEVTLGERYRAGWFKRWLYGSDYRNLWTTPIEFEVLDLNRFGGGLTPVRTGGFGQTVSLQCTGGDGRPYTVRSIDKDPTRRLEKELKGTFIEDIVRDMISSQLPTGGLVIDPLLEATGILHSTHKLVVIPDDPGLGEFREFFAGLPGVIQEHPMDGPDESPGFAGSRKICSTKKLWGHLKEGPHNRVDSRTFLKATLVDFLIGDKDRHAGNWRWARFPDGDGYTWVPIPEDRDQAFIDYDGLVMAIVRRAAPRFVRFERSYPSHKGLSRNCWEIDREFLVDLEKPVWDSLVTVIQNELTDPIIEDAVRRLPPPFYNQVGVFVESALKQRRDNLSEFADKYYRFITHDAEITATDQDEIVQLAHQENGELVVQMTVADSTGKPEVIPYFQRTFHPDVTNEVRMYLGGGDDQVNVTGDKGKITLRIDGEEGDDLYANASQASAGKTRFYDSRGANQFIKGNGAKIDERPYARPSPSGSSVDRYKIDWGHEDITFPLVSVDPDLGFYLGMVGARQYFGYRKDPYASKHSVNLGLASNGPEPLISYTGRFRHVLPSIDFKLHLEYSGINVIRFNGLGNETKTHGASSFYKVEQSEFILSPAFEFRAGSNLGSAHGVGKQSLRSTFTAAAGPIVKYSDTPLSGNEDKYIGTLALPPYGAESFGQIGVQGTIEYDTRNNPGHATKGLYIEISGAVYPEIWDAESAFEVVEGAASTYLTAPIPTEPTLALRAGGKKVWGAYPFHEAAYIGGPGTLRGFRKDRFGGDESVYGNAELRLRLFKMKLLLPGEFGLFGAADAGRVYFRGDSDDADEWHTAVGGGFWVSFIRRMQTLSVAIMNGDDLTGAYLRAGFMF